MYEYYYLCLVNKTFASKLRGLIGCEIVLICDDSGSMNTELGKLLISYNYFFLNALLFVIQGDVTGPFQNLPTRCKFLFYIFLINK